VTRSHSLAKKKRSSYSSQFSTHITYLRLVSRAKWRTRKKCSLEIRFARRSDARLPYPTLTGGHQVCITRKGDPALRLLTNRGQENHLFASSVSTTEAQPSTCGRTDNSETQGLASSWDIILIPAQDATQRRGAATTRREAGLGARGVTKINTGTRTSKHQYSDPQAPTQPIQRHKRCKPDGWEHGYNARHPHPWQAQPAATIGPYNLCNTTNAAAPTWTGKNSTAKVKAPNPASTIPSLRGRIRASPLGPRT